MKEEPDRVNVDFLAKRASDIRSAASTLRTIGKLPKEQFLADQTVIDAAKYRLVVATEAAISICAHLAVRMADRAPDTYAQCFDVLAEAGILSVDLAQRMGNMARFRNLLVHGYGDVDDGRLWEFLQIDLNDLNEYLSQIGQALEERCQ